MKTRSIDELMVEYLQPAAPNPLGFAPDLLPYGP